MCQCVIFMRFFIRTNGLHRGQYLGVPWADKGYLLSQVLIDGVFNRSGAHPDCALSRERRNNAEQPAAGCPEYECMASAQPSRFENAVEGAEMPLLVAEY